ncbi:helix-turn-helix domain-containing protein [Bacillaceae bacterium Marseille-Q3522]|nr:helix-turn-helix domain-containing protein [Bacillaceae bacterium Marseille-Q3522]
MLGHHIKRLRRMKGLSLNEMAKKSGVSKSYLSYIERGMQKNPSLQTLQKLANTLDTDVESLINLKKENPQSKDLQLKDLDTEWIALIEEAIQMGITKEEFSYYLNVIKFKKKDQT